MEVSVEEKIMLLESDQRWSIFAEDPEHWRLGLYHPEYKSVDEIAELEKHSCPELFICCGGKMGIILDQEDSIVNLVLNDKEMLLVNSFHNAYQIDEGAYFLVVERDNFTTSFKKIT